MPADVAVQMYMVAVQRRNIVLFYNIYCQWCMWLRQNNRSNAAETKVATATSSAK
jgi:hypothetical protein